jgi:hypothetical protein
MWYTGVSDLYKGAAPIEEKQIHILRAPNGEFDDKTYRSMPWSRLLPMNCPYIKRAGELENAGTPLYFFRDRPCRHYGKVLEQIAGRICGGEKA